MLWFGDLVWFELRKKIGDFGWWVFFFFFSCCGLLVVVVVVVVGVIVVDSVGGCDWLLKFATEIVIIILTSFLYYFNQIVKNIVTFVGAKSLNF